MGWLDIMLLHVLLVVRKFVRHEDAKFPAKVIDCEQVSLSKIF